MPKTNVYNMAGEAIGEIELSDAIFGIEPNEAVLHAAVRNFLMNRRQGTQSTLTRGDVSGGGRKPWRQKGTGRARTGSTRAPNWTHGGVAFAPKPRDYSYTLNRKVKRIALKSALSAKVQDSDIIVIDKLAMDAIKTAEFKKFLNSVNAAGKAMIVTAENNDIIIKSARNIPGVTTTTAGILSPYEIMTCGKFIIDEAALRRIEEVYA